MTAAGMDTQTLADRAAITDLLALYCRGVDRMDEATLRSIYHDDATEDRGAGLFIGRAQDWVAWTLGLLPVFAMTQHNVLQTLIELDGDVAEGETYFIAYHRFAASDPAQVAEAASAPSAVEDELEWPEGETELLLAGRYLDRFERRDGAWKIAYRRMVCDWCRTQPAADGWFGDNPTVYRGVRSIADSRLSTASPSPVDVATESSGG